ncbi:GH25 family lysozyme [Enterococcus sp. AZ103]|uniref:GH25 family lysozyme n=1 Tax=Enterococcus sp. AZ103 TaxID=2774628 RepID=UPI003F1EBBB8
MLNGIDIASWQAGINVGAGGVAADFVIIKATGGVGYTNPYFQGQLIQAMNSGKEVALYHYANEIGLEGTAIQEAQHFLKQIASYIGKVNLVLDWESTNKANVAWAKAFLDYVREQTGSMPFFYTYTGVVNAYNFSSIAQAGYPLWIANYYTDQPQGYSQPNPPVSNHFSTTAMFQYTSNGWLDGYGSRLDLNVFYGTREDWRAYIGGQKIEKIEEVIEEEEDMIYAFANRGAIFYVQGGTIGVLQNEDDWKAIRGVYSQTHEGKELQVFDWRENNSTADAVFRTLGYYKDKAFRESTTNDISTILESMNK